MMLPSQCLLQTEVQTNINKNNKKSRRPRDPKSSEPIYQPLLTILGQLALWRKPLQNGLVGPSTLVKLTILNTIVAYVLTDPRLRWNGWTEEAGGQFLGSSEVHRLLYPPLSLLVLGLLAVVRCKNPGYLRAEDVAEAQLLAADIDHPARVEMGMGAFGVLLPTGQVQGFKWCRTCEWWRPCSASHCSRCNRCVKRFDHHCPAVDACIGAGNHAAFAAMLASAAAAWSFTIVSVSAQLINHGAIGSLFNWKEIGPGQWPLYLGLVFATLGTYCLAWLWPFAIFHVLALLFNFNTKMVCSAKELSATWSQVNSREVLEELFCSPCEPRAGALPAVCLPTEDSDSDSDEPDDDDDHDDEDPGDSIV